MSDARDIIVGIAGTVVGWIVGFLSGFGLATYQDKLARQRELDKEQRDRDEDSKRQKKESQQLPSLMLDFDNNSQDCIYPHEYVPQKTSETVAINKEKRTDLYISLIVRNDGSTTVHNCIGELFKLELAKNTNSQFEDIPIQGRQELKWSFDDNPVDLAPDATKSLNVFIAHSSDEFLDVQVKKENLPLANAMKHKGTFRFTIAVHSDEVFSKSLTLAVLWEGSIDGQWSEKNIWIVE